MKLATFLGSGLAGATLMLINNRRLGREENYQPLVVGGGLLVVVFLLGLVLPENFPNSPFVIAQFFAMGAYFKLAQGPLVVAHLANQGEMESGWKAAGIGLIFLAGILAIALPLIFWT